MTPERRRSLVAIVAAKRGDLKALEALELKELRRRKIKPNYGEDPDVDWDGFCVQFNVFEPVRLITSTKPLRVVWASDFGSPAGVEIATDIDGRIVHWGDL